MRKIATIFGVFACLCGYAQQPSPAAKRNVAGYKADIQKEEGEGDEDLEYEIRHKSQPWFSQMSRPGADYFTVKKNFEKYFAQHRWEKSKPRELGESWLKSNIFYLDKNGKVQAPPEFDPNRYESSKANRATGSTTRTVGSWSMIGPVNSATTRYSGSGNHGGYAYMVRIDPTNTQKIFAGFVTGGLWMSNDGGVSWTLTDGNAPAATYIDVDVCVRKPKVVYAISQKQVMKSVDGGLNWKATALNAINYPGTAYDIAVSPTEPNTVVARWGDKIYRSTDGGDSWAVIVSDLPNYSIWDCNNTGEMLDWSTTDKNVVYFLSSREKNQVTVYRSPDNGGGFTAITTITLDTAANGQVVGWAKLLLPSDNASDIYVAIGTGTSAYGHHAVQLYKLNNTTGAEVMKRVNMVSGKGQDELHHGDVAMDRNNENRMVWATYSQNYVHYSTDNGASFVKAASTTHSDLRSLSMVDNKVAIGSDGEVALSGDGGVHYATVSNTISNHELWGFGAAFKTNIVAAGCNHGPVMILEPNGVFEWYNGTGADQGNTDVNPLDDRYVYSQGYSNYRYFRTGVHKLINESNMLDLGGIYAYYNSIEFHPNYYYSIITHHAGQYPSNNPDRATWKNSLVKTEDNGKTISIVKTFGSQVFREKICMTNPNYMYAVVGLTSNRLWRTTDGGTTWADITPSPEASSGQANISDLAVSDVNQNEVWLTYSSVQTGCKVLKTTDGGGSWANLTQPILTASPITKIIFQRGSDGGVYIGNKTGIYYRNNSMKNWEQLGKGLPEMDIRFMFINYNLGKLRIGTSRGAWEHELYEVSPPKAQVSASIKKVVCSETDTVQFKDYSVVRNSSATWAWSFPGGTPSTSTLENPVVSYKNAPDGSYNVTLTVTDSHGTSSQTIKNMIEVYNKCGSPPADTKTSHKP
ncbi:MAG: PKD domain-containing protein [Bacteroidota bacterium]